nr:integrase, catalytic region, zinc finger, CCHC-type, peptidase aspartic, catalytic [Tanacetum cinerariifolium]
MAADSRDRPPVLTTGRYAQWRSRFLQCIDTRPNGDALRKCILEGPYTLSTIAVPAVPTSENSSAFPEHTTLRKYGKLSKGYNKANHSTFKMSRQTYFDNLENSSLTMEKQWNLITQEVNELRAERIARNANPLALVVTAQSNQDPYSQTPKSHKPYAPTSKPSIPNRSHATTRNKGKEIAKPISPPSESASEEDSGPEQAQRDKDMQKILALIAKYFKKIYKPTNNNLRTSSNSRNKNVGTTPRYINDNQSAQFRNRRTMTVVGARENLGSLVVQQTGIQCFNCKEFGHFAKKCRKPKRVKDFTYHKEKMLLCKQVEQETSKTLEESNSVRDSCLVALQTKQTEFEKYKACNDRTVHYDKLEHANTELQYLYLHKVMECECLALKILKQTKAVSQEVYTELLQRFDKLEKYSISLELALQECEELMKNDTICKEKASNVFKKEREQYFEIQDLKAQLQYKDIAISELKKLIEKCKGKSVETKFDKPSVVRQPNTQRILNPPVLGKPAPFSDSFERKRPSMYRINNKTTQTRAPQLPQTSRNTNPRLSISTGVAYKTNVSRPQLRSNQMTDKVVPNNSHVKAKKTKVEDHHRISSISNKRKSVTACNGSLKSRTSNEPNVVPISARKPKSQAKKSVATPRKKTDASETTTQKSKSYYRMLHEKTSKAWKWWIERQWPSGTVRFGNDQFAPILGYGDLVHGNITINRVYYIEGLNHNLFSVGQFCDADLEVAF